MIKDTEHHLNSQLWRYVGQNIEKEHGTPMPSPRRTRLPTPPCVHHPGSSPNLIIYRFLWKLHHIGTMHY